VRLYGSLTSPFVRAVRIAAVELGVNDQIDFAPTVVRPTEPNRDFGAAVNPLRRVPALACEDGRVLVDSRVIIEFLNHRAGGDIIPGDADARIAAFNRHAIAAGATEALVLAMYERRLRPEDRRWPEWSADQRDKARAALDWAEGRARDFTTSFDIGAISLVCLIGYAELRFPETRWLDGRPRLSAFAADAMRRTSVAATAPPRE
jgi:glutathione S-transferase